MKYMLLMSGTRADFDWYAGWPADQLRAHMEFLRKFTQDLKESGSFVVSVGLGFPHAAKLVVAGRDAEPLTDGVFAESKEFLAGYWIVDVEGPEEAYRLAARVSAAPGNEDRGNRPVEVRQVMSGPSEELS